jgi:GT2 family glycosyltransferase
MAKGEAAAATRTTVLQEMMRPEPGVCTERDLYIRLDGAAALCGSSGAILLETGGRAEFDTYFNMFDLSKWAGPAALRALALRIEGAGRMEICVFHAMPGRSLERLTGEVVSLEDGAPWDVDLSGVCTDGARGVLYLTVLALGSARIAQAAWHTDQPPLRRPEILLSITTFRREKAVARSVARFQDWAARHPLGPRFRALVVDNGRTVPFGSEGRVEVVPNANLGGAGGFARGLMEARARAVSHCLFMDDDAAIHMDSLARTWTFLAYAVDDATAVAGAMIDASRKWSLWENGALFDGRCVPLHIGTDLREADEVLDLLFDAAAPTPSNFYGGWWFFAFPLDHVRHLPFPFFVRGDDVGFSLAHDFDIVTLNGVVSFQEGFVGKESPLTWYLDLRSHMAHHLSFPHMDRGWRGLARMCVWFYLRNLIRLHYETLSAVNLAIEDVLRGPAFFAETPDMADRRADIAALRRDEAFAPAGPLPAPDRVRLDPDNPVWRWAMKLTLNGHLVPGFRLFGNRVTLPAVDKGRVRSVWGAARITIRDEADGTAYTVTHSKAAAARQAWRMARNLIRLHRRMDALRAEWQAAYPDLTSTPFWRRSLGMPPSGDTDGAA